MKQTLQLRLGQHLTMTPQLQQAIRLLQLSTLDLQQEIQQALDSNMMLEVEEDETRSTQEENNSETEKDSDSIETNSEDLQSNLPDELPVDTSWEDVYQNVQSTMPAGPAPDQQEFDNQSAQADSLQAHLLWQMELTPFSERDRAMAMAVIDSIDDSGYLAVPIEEIFNGLESQLEDLELDEMSAVLHRVQSFDPPGIAAVDLGDCLRIQLTQLPSSTPWREPALHLVTHFLDHLAAQDQNRLKRLLRLSDEDLGEVIALIRSLNPRPGSRLQSSDTQYVVPDVFVSKKNGKWQVVLNPDIAPKLRVNPFYSSMIKRADSSADNTSMKNHLQEARWFLKSLQSRSETLLKVANCIVEEQSEFLEHGPISMKPLVLRNVAETVEMHESTISRVTTQKYMHTPNGIFEFKHFFSSHVSTVNGGECSSTAIRALIKQLLEHENLAKPLSDSKISALLKDKGINVARRTVAKYREAMLIPPSNQRKRII